MKTKNYLCKIIPTMALAILAIGGTGVNHAAAAASQGNAVVQFGVTAVRVREAGRVALVWVTRGGSVANEATVHIETADLSATDGND